VLARAVFGDQDREEPNERHGQKARPMEPGERMDNSQKTVLLMLFDDRVPWTLDELGRELKSPLDAADAVSALAGAGTRASARRLRDPHAHGQALGRASMKAPSRRDSHSATTERQALT